MTAASTTEAHNIIDQGLLQFIWSDQSFLISFFMCGNIWTKLILTVLCPEIYNLNKTGEHVLLAI